jgi:hypothetical protein
MRFLATLTVLNGLSVLCTARERRGRVVDVLEKRQEAQATYPAHTIEQPVWSLNLDSICLLTIWLR